MKALVRASSLPLLLVAAASAFALALASWGEARVAAAARARAQAQERFEAARNQLARVSDERRTVERYGPAYRELVARGIIGVEARVAWLDALRSATLGVGSSAEYRVGALEPAAFDLAVPVRRAVMDVRLPLLHEGDLLSFLRALDAANAGIVLTESCTLTRLRPPGELDVEPQLRAECRLSGLSLVPEAGP